MANLLDLFKSQDRAGPEIANQEQSREHKDSLPSHVEDEQESSISEPTQEHVDTEGTSQAEHQPDISQHLEAVMEKFDLLTQTTSLIHASLAQHQDLSSTLENISSANKGMSQRIRECEDNLIQESILKPILSDLVHLVDLVSGLRKQDSARVEPQLLLESLESSLLETLRRYGIVKMQDTTTSVDPKKQRVVGVKKLPAPKNGQIAKVSRSGFYLNDNIFRHEEVIVNSYKEDSQ